MSGRSNNLRVQVDVESQFTGEKSFKSAEASALAMAKAMDKVDAAARAMAAAEAAAYREVEKAAAERRSAARAMAQQEAAAYREGEQMAAKREADLRRHTQLEITAYREAQQASERAAAARRMADSEQREAMTKVGTVLAATSAAAVVGLSIATKAAMSWESAWAGVTKTVDGSPEQMDALEGSLRSLAKTLPASQEEIAGVAEAAGQLGVKRADIVGFTKTMIDLGETTNLTADEAASGLAKLMNVMQTAPDDVGRLGATLVALGNDGASTEADILAMAQRISGAGKLVGASESDVLALANAMSSVGIEAELGGGVTTRVMQKIYSAVKEGGDGLASFAQVAGMSSEQFATAWQTSPVAALDAVFQGLGRVNASGGNTVEVLSDLGLKGTEEASVLLRMAGAGDLLSRSLALGNTAWAENAALAAEANKRYATTEARAEMARNKINDMAIDIGGNLLPALAEGADFVGNLSAAFGSLSEGQQQWVVALGAGAAGITGVVGVAAVAIPKVYELKNTLDELAGGSSRLGKGLGTAMSVMTGPWGLALAGATVLVGAWAAEQGAAAQRVESLSEAIDGQTGAFTENARALVAKNLEDKGALSAAQTLGLQLDVVTDAALGQADAMRQVQAAIQAANDAEHDASLGRAEYTDATIANADAAALLERMIGSQRGETDEAIEAAKRKAEAMGEDTSATAAAGDASQAAAGQVEELGRSTDASAEAVEKLGDAIRNALGQFFDVENATSAVEEAIDSMTEAVAQNGTTTDLTTEKGRANAKALQERVTSAGDLIAAMAREGQSSEELSTKTQKLKDDFVAQMTAAGFSKEAIDRYAASFDLIPAQVQTTVQADTTSAQDRISALTKSILAMPSVTITPQLRASNSYYANRADGAVVDYYADGGLAGMTALPRENHVAQIAPAGSWRVWAEDETGGEAYIPLTPAKRDRSKAITEDVVARFGGHVEWYASGGIAGAGPAVVSKALVASALTATIAPVDGSRHAAALTAEAQAAAKAAAAEQRLNAVRAIGEAQLERYKDQLQAAEDALDAQHEASEEAAAKDLDALEKRNSEAERALKERNSDELDALRSKTKDQGRIKALQRQQDQAERDLAAKHEAAEETAQGRIAEAKKANKTASEELSKANDKAYDQRKNLIAEREAVAEGRLGDAKDAAKDATEELTAAEQELNEARERAVDLAKEVASTLVGGAGLDRLFGDTSAADLTATAKALEAAAQAADAAQRNGRDEDATSALTRRSAALSELVASATAYAAAQEAMNFDQATITAGLDQVRAKVTDLGAAYGLSAEQVAELTGSLQVQRTTAADLLASRQRELARATEMASAVKSLAAAGLDRDLLDQVRSGGTGGLALARSLLANPELIGQFNANQAALTAVGNDLGATLADARYGSGSAGSSGGYTLTSGTTLPNTVSTVSLSGSTEQLLQRVLTAVSTRSNQAVYMDGDRVGTVMDRRAADQAFANPR